MGPTAAPRRVFLTHTSDLGKPEDDRPALGLARGARGEFGRSPLRVEWDESGRRPSSKAFVRRFGGWREACWAADQAPPTE